MPTTSSWATAEIDALISEARREIPPVPLTGIETMIRERFRIPITKGMVTRRCRTLKLPQAAQSIIPQRPPVPLSPWEGRIPEWMSRASDELLAIDNGLGCLRRMMADRHGVSLNRLEKRVKKLKLVSGVPCVPPPRPIEGTRVPGPAPLALRTQSPPKPIGAPKNKPDDIAPLIEAKTAAHRMVVFSAIKWSVGTLPKPPQRVPGHCCWPLSCDAPANGHWCADHAGQLSGRRAA
jgi:hypothetical protein